MNIFAQISTGTAIAIAVGPFGAIIGVIYWISKTKVNHTFCKIVRDDNKEDHEHLREYIKDTEARAENRHKELKESLDKIESLIQSVQK